MDITTLHIHRSQGNRLAILPREDQMASPAFFTQICHILMGNHPLSATVLYPVEPGTSLSQVGASRFLYLCFYTLPESIAKWIYGIERFLPPNYGLVGGGSLMQVALAIPQVGSFPAICLGVAPSNT